MDASSHQAGDATQGESLEALFHALESPLLGYAARLVSDADAAQDVVQEAFLRLHAQGDRVKDRRSWLYRTVHNLALNHRRDGRRLVPFSPIDTTDSTPQSHEEETQDLQPLPDEQIARLEGIGLVRLSLGQLDPRDRELIKLKFEEGLSYKDMASRTGLTASHVGYLLHHALKTLAAEVSKAGLIP